MVNNQISNIEDAVAEMDGNTSGTEEEEDIDAIKDYIPELKRNVQSNLETLDRIELFIEDIIKNEAFYQLGQLKNDAS